MKNGQLRRNKIIELLSNATEPFNATAIAKELSVTRQIIVSDVALLRAAGYKIRSLHRGYMLENDDNGLIKKYISCKHDKNNVRDEFYAVVDNGGRVEDISITHPIYGKISADLSITSRYEADCFIERACRDDASQLASLTGGEHVHTIVVKDEETFERICNKLTELGILLGTADAN